MELMISIAARSLEDGAVVVVGTGVPCAAAMLAQMTQSPNLTVLFEAGGIAPLLPAMPISVGDSRTTYKGLKATSMAEIMELCQVGIVDYCFLGGAQIDKYGNLNSTIIGNDHSKPKTHKKQQIIPVFESLPNILTGEGIIELSASSFIFSNNSSS